MQHHTTFDDALLAAPRPIAAAPADMPAEALWAEHGWGLDARGVALLLAVIGLAGLLARFLA